MKFFNTIATLLLMLVATTAFAQGNGAQTEKFEFAIEDYYNPCCDEVVSLGGTIHTSFRVKGNGDGTLTITDHGTAASVKGTGSNGTRYVGSETTKFSQTFYDVPGPTSLSVVQYTKLIGTGRDGHECTFKVKITWDLVIDDDGNVVVDDYELELICANGAEIL